MTKILLVEDDKSLREIYGVRLKAEGYDIVSAGDGEEALAMAIKERPDLVISDVMMPKVSGFDMLDILRSTTETKDIKVIVMTALSSEEQRQRGEMLGADKYLVKSQVGIEDVVRAVHEVMGDAPTQDPMDQEAPFAAPIPTIPTGPVAPVAQPVTPQPDAQPLVQPVTPVEQPVPAAPIVQPVAEPVAELAPAQPVAPAPTPQLSQQPNTALPNTPQPIAPQPVLQPVAQPVAPAEQPAPATPPAQPAVEPTVGLSSRPGNRIIQPISDPSQPTFDIGALLDREIAKEAGVADVDRPVVMSAAESQAMVQEQIDNAAEKLESIPNANINQESTQIDTVATNDPSIDAPNVPSIPLQSRENEPVITPQPRPEQNGSALSGTTLPPASTL